MNFKYLFVIISFIIITFHSIAAFASPYPVCDIQPTPPKIPKDNSYTRYISLDKDIVFRIAGNFNTMYYYPDKSTPYQYLGGTGALMISWCKSYFCMGIEQSMGGIFPYSGAAPRPILATYALIGVRFIVLQRTIMTFSLAGGFMYDDNTKSNKVFINTQFGGALKLDWDWTLYIIPDFGIGLHASPGIVLLSMSHVINLEAGLHFTFKY